MHLNIKSNDYWQESLLWRVQRYTDNLWRSEQVIKEYTNTISSYTLNEQSIVHSHIVIITVGSLATFSVFCLLWSFCLIAEQGCHYLHR